MRTLYLIGKITRRREMVIAKRCAWCRGWYSWLDRVKHALGAATSHGMCAACVALHEEMLGCPTPGTKLVADKTFFLSDRGPIVFNGDDT